MVEDFKMKEVKSKFLQNLIIVTPLIEEITERNLAPICLIGFAPAADDQKEILVHFATVSDDDNAETVLYELCEHLLKSRKLNSDTNAQASVATDDDSSKEAKDKRIK